MRDQQKKMDKSWMHFAHSTQCTAMAQLPFWILEHVGHMA